MFSFLLGQKDVKNLTNTVCLSTWTLKCSGCMLQREACSLPNGSGKACGPRRWIYHGLFMHRLGERAIMTDTHTLTPPASCQEQCCHDTHDRPTHTYAHPRGLVWIIRMKIRQQCVSQSVGLLRHRWVKLSIRGSSWGSQLSEAVRSWWTENAGYSHTHTHMSNGLAPW